MSYDALRRGRASLSGHAYFVTTSTYSRLPLFSDMNLARLVIWQMRELHDAGYLHSFCWVLMPDHLHWLFQLKEKGPLGDVVGRFKSNSARAINRYRGESGAVWQRAYYDRAIRREESLIDVSRYIVANPLRAGLVSRVGDYPHWDAEWL